MVHQLGSQLNISLMHQQLSMTSNDQRKYLLHQNYENNNHNKHLRIHVHHHHQHQIFIHRVYLESQTTLQVHHKHLHHHDHYHSNNVLQSYLLYLRHDLNLFINNKHNNVINVILNEILHLNLDYLTLKYQHSEHINTYSKIIFSFSNHYYIQSINYTIKSLIFPFSFVEVLGFITCSLHIHDISFHFLYSNKVFSFTHSHMITFSYLGHLLSQIKRV